MIQIDRHIEILLLGNDCVIVPGLGGFIAHHVPARYCDDTHSFLPPTRELGFNAQLRINDSLLAQSYIEAYDISYPEAIRRIEDEVEELSQMLQNEGRCELNDIGVLRLNEEGNIEFEPCSAGLLTPGLYALDLLDVTLLGVEPSAQGRSSEPVLDFNPVISPEPHPIPQLAAARRHSATDGKAAHDDQDTEKYIRIRVSTVRNVMTAAAVVLALFLCSIPFGRMSQQHTSKSYLNTGILYDVLPECVRVPSDALSTTLVFKATEARKSPDIPEAAATAPAKPEEVQAKDAASPAASPSEATASEAASSSKTPAPSEVTGKRYFSIVLASCLPKSRANAFIRKLGKNGYDSAEALSCSNGTKVIYGRFPSRAKAQHFLKGVRPSSDYFKDGWIMEVES